jgi:hypothetical protein
MVRTDTDVVEEEFDPRPLACHGKMLPFNTGKY